MMNLKGKTIWVTGATSGIGEGVAYELAKCQTRLILSGRNKASLDKVAKHCEELGATTRIEPFDLAIQGTIESAVQRVLADGEKVFGLFNFGGISQRSFVLDTPVEIDRIVMETNFFGTVVLTKGLLPQMVKNGGGVIVATSSIVGKFGFPYRSAYSASKHALHGFFESLRAENTRNNIQVTMLLPGRVATNVSMNAITNTGERYGKMDKGQAGGMSVERSAKIICKGVRRGKKEVLYGGISTIMVHIRRWFPRLYYFLSSRVEPL